jgi:hypothetical protein
MKRILFTAGVVLIGSALLFHFSSTSIDINAMINESGNFDQTVGRGTIETIVRAVNVLIGFAGLMLAALGYKSRKD